MDNQRKRECLERIAFEKTKDRKYSKEMSERAENINFDGYELLIEMGEELLKKEE